MALCRIGKLETAHEGVHNRGSQRVRYEAVAGEVTHGADAEGRQRVTQAGDADREPVREHVATYPG